MPKFLFFDTKPELIKSYKRYLDRFPEVECVLIDVLDLGRTRTIDVLVSPANSYGFMDGGIDKVYMTMFDDIQGDVQRAIQKYGCHTQNGAHREINLPVGSALRVAIRHLPNHPRVATDMICAPTMRWPRDIRNSQGNIYFAMIAILRLAEHCYPGDETVIAIPGLGTGCGALTGDQSGYQIAQAFQDYHHDQKLKLDVRNPQRYLTESVIDKKYPTHVQPTYAPNNVNAFYHAAYTAYPPFLQ